MSATLSSPTLLPEPAITSFETEHEPDHELTGMYDPDRIIPQLITSENSIKTARVSSDGPLAHSAVRRRVDGRDLVLYIFPGFQFHPDRDVPEMVGATVRHRLL